MNLPPVTYASSHVSYGLGQGQYQDQQQHLRHYGYAGIDATLADSNVYAAATAATPHGSRSEVPTFSSPPPFAAAATAAPRMMGANNAAPRRPCLRFRPTSLPAVGGGAHHHRNGGDGGGDDDDAARYQQPWQRRRRRPNDHEAHGGRLCPSHSSFSFDAERCRAKVTLRSLPPSDRSALRPSLLPWSSLYSSLSSERLPTPPMTEVAGWRQAAAAAAVTMTTTEDSASVSTSPQSRWPTVSSDETHDFVDSDTYNDDYDYDDYDYDDDDDNDGNVHANMDRHGNETAVLLDRVLDIMERTSKRRKEQYGAVDDGLNVATVGVVTHATMRQGAVNGNGSSNGGGNVVAGQSSVRADADSVARAA